MPPLLTPPPPLHFVVSLLGFHFRLAKRMGAAGERPPAAAAANPAQGPTPDLRRNVLPALESARGAGLASPPLRHPNPASIQQRSASLWSARHVEWGMPPVDEGVLYTPSFWFWGFVADKSCTLMLW